MDIRKVKKLIDLVNETGIAELEIREGEESVRVTRMNSAVAAPVSYPVIPASSHEPRSVVSSSHSIVSHSVELEEDLPEGHRLLSPMVGTFYLSSSPGAPPFVTVGKRVEVGDTVCVIEAMKMFNTIEADKAGVVKACLVENAQPVEYGEPLFIIG